MQICYAQMRPLIWILKGDIFIWKVLYISQEFHLEKGKLWTKKKIKKWTKFVRRVIKVSSLWLLKTKIKFKRQDIFWVKISECTVSKSILLHADMPDPTQLKNSWTGSHFCHPDVKLTQAELLYIVTQHCAETDESIVLYNLMRGMQGERSSR